MINADWDARRKYFVCECECGVQTTTLASHVLSGKTKSCGCFGALVGGIRARKGHGEISGTYWSAIKSSARIRKISFDLSIEDGWELFLNQERKCAITKLPLSFYTSNRRLNKKNQTASLDRINNKLGYVKGNVWWVHKTVNRLKSDLDLSELLFWVSKIASYKIPIKEHERPSWENYFIGIAHVISSRSHDVHTKHGCIITDRENKILSTGYNGFAKSLKDNLLPTTRPEKYDYMIHAETNAVLNAKKDLSGCTAWVTGESCNSCLMNMWQAGIERVVCDDRYGSILLDEHTRRVRANFLSQTGMKFEILKADLSWLQGIYDIFLSDC